MKKRMIIVTALIMGTLGAGCVSVQASDTLPELTKDNALEQMMKAGETDSLVSNHKSYEATCEYILQNTKVYDYEDSEVMYVDMYGTTQMLYKDGELKYGKEGDEYLSCLYIDEADGNADDLISFYTDETIEEEVTDMKEDGDVRNVTVTAAPGTELEKDYAITVPADNHVWIMLHDDSSYYVLYTDKECKELHEPEENVKGDTHLYAEIRSYEDYEETEDEV